MRVALEWHSGSIGLGESGRATLSLVHGRSITHVILTIEELPARAVLLRSLREGVDFPQPVARMLAGIFAAVAEYVLSREACDVTT